MDGLLTMKTPTHGCYRNASLNTKLSTSVWMGYGTIHSLIQFRDALKAKTPVVAVLVYGDMHDERNTFLRSRREVVALYNKLGPLDQPYARLDQRGKLRYAFANVQYSELPMVRHSALIR